MSKLNENIVYDLENTKEKLDDLKSQIRDRVQYILEYLVEVLNKGVICWWEFGANHFDEDIFENIHDEHIKITGQWDKMELLPFIDRDGKIWVLEGSIPTRWLWEDFENEYKEGRQKYLDSLKKPRH